MSGICGIFNLDDKPVEDGELAAMTAMMKQRGPDAARQWSDGAIGLGHALLATTPELVFERQPFSHPETGCVITADVRLDNREELLAALTQRKGGDSIGDAELILRAYLRWGDSSVDHLLGDFAFAIWNPGSGQLYCARDHFGMRPFYYHHAPGKRFVFSSSAQGVLVLPQVPYRINEGRVADFLVPELEWIDYTTTFFEEIKRLPPGHKATFSRRGLKIEEYWKPQPVPLPGPLSDEEWREGFLEVFTQSVESRIRAPSGTVASTLSGGVDSGSVVAIAKDLLAARGQGPLPTFSAVRRDDEDCAETNAVKAAISMPNLAPSLVYLETIPELIEQLTDECEEPFDGEVVILKALYLAARSQGKRVVLDGGGGDILLDEGTYFSRLIRKGRITLALREIAAAQKYGQTGSLASWLFRHTRAALTPAIIKEISRRPRHRHSARACVKASLISPDLANSVDILGRFERMQSLSAAGWETDYSIERCNAIRPNVTAGRERYARIAASTGIESRDPFLDKRVVDFCSMLPGHLRLRDGWPKVILREVMTDTLPAEILWTRRKRHLGWLFNAAVTRQAMYLEMLDIDEIQNSLDGYVDRAALTTAWKTFREGGEADQIHTAHVLSAWLENSANRPVVSGQPFV